METVASKRLKKDHDRDGSKEDNEVAENLDSDAEPSVSHVTHVVTQEMFGHLLLRLLAESVLLLVSSDGCHSVDGLTMAGF